MLREHRKTGNCLRFYEAELTSTITFFFGNEYGEPTFANGTEILYSIDGETWNEYTPGTQIQISAVGGESQYTEIYFKANGDNCWIWEEDSQAGTLGKFTVSGKCKCDGDVMSLLNDGGNATVAYHRVFWDMFNGTDITTAPYISAPTLMQSCFRGMFEDCTYLVWPMLSLPASKVSVQGYQEMFKNCTSLRKTPDLMFTEVDGWSCEQMFYGCSVIESVYLRPNELKYACFKQMFENCIALHEIRCRFIKWPEYRQQYHTNDDLPYDQATYDWTKNVASTGTFERDYRLPLYINDEPTSGIDTGSGEKYNWDNVHAVDYNTEDMYHFDPWVGKESVNITTFPACAVRYRTTPVEEKDGSMTVRFNFLTQTAITGSENTDFVSEDITDKVEEVLEVTEPSSYTDASHAGRLNVRDLFTELFEIVPGDPIYITPDKNVWIDWGDGEKTVIPANRVINPALTTPFSEQSAAQNPNHSISGVFSHTYQNREEGEQFIIVVCSEDISADDLFFTTIEVNDVPKYKGCMPPLCALAGSNIEELLTPLLPIYGGDRENEMYYPIPFMFYGNTDLKSVPYYETETGYGTMYAKLYDNVSNPFGLARTFEGCTSLTVLPVLKSAPPQYDENEENIGILSIPFESNNSCLEGFAKNCTSIFSAKIPNQTLAPFMLAEFASGASSLKAIYTDFSEWPVYDSPDPYATDLMATWLWTKDVYQEYSDAGRLYNDNRDSNGDTIVSRRSLPADGYTVFEDEHEFNPWTIKTLPDDWYLTFTNDTSSQQNVVLTNQRVLFASKVDQNSDARTLELETENSSMTHPDTIHVDCHIHRLEYRKSLNGIDYGPWLEITDDTLNNGYIHSTENNGAYQSELITGEYAYQNMHFYWKIVLENTQKVQLRGVPCTFGMYDFYREGGEDHAEFYEYSNTDMTLLSDIDNLCRRGLKFDDHDYWSDGEDAAYYMNIDADNVHSSTYGQSGTNAHGIDTIPYSYDSDSGYTFFMGNRMFTGINLPNKWYQFHECEGLAVSGFIDTFFDYLDIRSKSFTAPPFTYMRLFYGTGIISAPKIYATGGADCGEFSSCFENCTSLTAPALMNINTTAKMEMNPNAPGPAQPLKFNYNLNNIHPAVHLKINASNIQFSESGTSSVSNYGILDATCCGKFVNIGSTNWPDGFPWQTILKYYHGGAYGAFEFMYKNCTSLTWPTVTVNGKTYPRQLSIISKPLWSKADSEVTQKASMNQMFMGCTSIGTFGLVTYRKRSILKHCWLIQSLIMFPTNVLFCLPFGIANAINPSSPDSMSTLITAGIDEYEEASILPNNFMTEMFMGCTEDEDEDYLWNCWYTNASLKAYTNKGNKDGLLASWQGGAPYSKWLKDTNIAKLYTNCADRQGQTEDVFAVSRGASHCGTIKHSAWQVACGDHYLSEANMPPYSNIEGTWVRWNTSPFSLNNKYMMTWRRYTDGSEINIEGYEDFDDMADPA